MKMSGERAARAPAHMQHLIHCRREETEMEAAQIRNRIKQIIANIAGIDLQRIADDASLRDDLQLDSLSLLEIGVDVDLAFQLDLPDESYRDVSTIPAMVELVERRLAELDSGGEAAGHASREAVER
jgi:acyl carrier protein